MKRFNWGWGIAIVYFIFAACTVSFVVFALSTPVDLVRSDYYEESLRQDSLMSERVRAQGVNAHITYQGGFVELSVLSTHRADGPIIFRFYKPDQPNLDIDISESFREGGLARVDVMHFNAGKWNATARWKSQNVLYEVNDTFMKE